MSRVDLKRDSEKRLKNKFSRKNKRNTKLQELEKQLQFAESRCGTLKQQLDYIKLLYGCRKCPDSDIQLQPSCEDGHGGGDNVSYKIYEGSPTWSQLNASIGSKENGDCPEFFNQKVSHSNTTFTNSSNKQTSVKEEEQKVKSNPNKRSHLKFQKFKKKNSKKIKKKRRADDASSSKLSNVSNRILSQVWQDPVVEIYKNSALNAESESGLELAFNKKRMKAEILSDLKKASGGSNKDGDSSKEKLPDEIKSKRSYSFGSKKVNVFKEEGIQTELTLEELLSMQNKLNEFNNFASEENQLKEYLPKENSAAADAAKLESNSLFEPVKSYCQPTISSKRKQVERDVYSNLNGINVRSIPFIAAKSTTPSHNIGVNIQQVLSIMKKRYLGSENSHLGENFSSNENRFPMTSVVGKKSDNGESVAADPPLTISETATAKAGSSESKKRTDGGIRSSISHWRSSSDSGREKQQSIWKEKVPNENQNLDWSLKIEKLKKVLFFLHEDFTSLSQKYKRLQKKLKKRNISKTDAKGELADIEKELEKKEEEITIVVILYKEVLNLREETKKLQEKNNLLTCGKAIILDGLKQSNSAHTQMTNLLRKIQNFQDRLKG